MLQSLFVVLLFLFGDGFVQNVYGLFANLTTDKRLADAIDSLASFNPGFIFHDIDEYTNVYLLYTRRNIDDYETIKYKDAQSIASSNFNVSNPTAVLVHGWTSDRNSDLNIALRSAFVMKADYNVIVVDWSSVGSQDYITAVEGVPSVGRYLGQFLLYLSDVTGVPITSLHLVGHSLGAHVVGNAGRELNGQVGRITGLDPAGPLWNTNDNRLRETDAIYVEAVHTNAGVFGIAFAVGDVDFYPNGGTSQPGCITDSCNHERSWQLFATSLLSDHFDGHKCSSILQFTFDECHGDTLKLGGDELSKNGTGVYRLTTTGTFPY